MIAYLLYNRDSPGQRAVEDLARRLERERVEVELVDADSARGAQLAENYDVLGRPAVVLITADGTPLQIWQGEDGLPALSDITYLAHQ